jgi:hypothetical protein
VDNVYLEILFAFLFGPAMLISHPGPIFDVSRVPQHQRTRLLFAEVFAPQSSRATQQ